MLKKKEVTVCI